MYREKQGFGTTYNLRHPLRGLGKYPPPIKQDIYIYKKIKLGLHQL
jgi:hypothetical protein